VRDGVVSIDQTVRYGETDQMGIAYYGNYPIWFEVGRTHYMAHYGVPYRDVEARGYFLPVSETYYRLIAPARYSDVITIDTWLAKLDSRRISFGYRVRRGSAKLAEGWTRLVCLNRQFRPTRLPAWVTAGIGPELGERPDLEG
jgi:acyl-CoA thioester hydrolase